jgi:hypothetical protein
MKFIFNIHRLIIRALFGKYSIQYIEFHRRRNARPDITPCLKDHYFPRFAPFFMKPKDSILVRSSEEIIFKDIPFLKNLRTSGILNQAPQCFSCYRIGGDVLKVIGYQKESHDGKLRENYYFVNDLFTMGEFGFPDVQHRDIQVVLKDLFEKYGIEDRSLVDNFYIEDPQGSLIYFVNTGFSLYIRYFNQDNSDLYNRIEKWFEPSFKPSEELKAKSKSRVDL